MKLQTKDSAKGLCVVIPIFLYFVIFVLVPFFLLFYYSFTDLEMFYGSEKWVGFDNYIKIFKYKEYVNSLITTFAFAFLIVIFGTVLGFFLALGINSLPVGRSFYRILFYLPALLSMVVVSKLVNTMLDYNFGSINAILVKLGHERIDWYQSVQWMYFYVVLIVVWKGLGGTALLFMAGLGGISKEIYEAADIDGAGKLKRMFSITLPLIRPMLGFVVITGFIGAFNIFEPIQFISLGQPNGQTETILYKIYSLAFSNQQLALASAVSVLVLVIVMGCTIVNMRLTNKNLLRVDKED